MIPIRYCGIHTTKGAQMITWETRKDYIKKLSHKNKVRFALFCAEQKVFAVEPVPEATAAIEVVKRWLDGNATVQECEDAAENAYAAAQAAQDAGTDYMVTKHVYPVIHAAYAVVAKKTLDATNQAYYAAHAASHLDFPAIAQEQVDYINSFFLS